MRLVGVAYHMACPTDLEWFKKQFDKGSKKRIEQYICFQLRVSIQVMKVMMERLECLQLDMEPEDEKDNILGTMVYVVVSYRNALRGNNLSSL